MSYQSSLFFPSSIYFNRMASSLPTTVSMKARVSGVMWSWLKSSMEKGLEWILCMVLVELATVATL